MRELDTNMVERGRNLLIALDLRALFILRWAYSFPDDLQTRLSLGKKYLLIELKKEIY